MLLSLAAHRCQSQISYLILILHIVENGRLDHTPVVKVWSLMETLGLYSKWDQRSADDVPVTSQAACCSLSNFLSLIWTFKIICLRPYKSSENHLCNITADLGFLINFLQSMLIVIEFRWCTLLLLKQWWLCSLCCWMNRFLLYSHSLSFRLEALIIWTVLGSLGPDRWEPQPTWRGRWAKGEELRVSIRPCEIIKEYIKMWP